MRVRQKLQLILCKLMERWTYLDSWLDIEREGEGCVKAFRRVGFYVLTECGKDTQAVIGRGLPAIHRMN